ncbi:guanine nucleotide binding protein, alpha subunit [Obelidium mucronatum]|nr:guanine nucleotide binding protein, alpha subunit [Obelidium mucronatum]
MGACESSPETQAALVASKEIDKLLKADAKTAADVVKLLLLGAGETGKSTILKQIRIIYSSGFAAEEQQSYRTAILGNLVTCSKCLVFAMDTLKIPYGFEPSKFEGVVEVSEPLGTILAGVEDSDGPGSMYSLKQSGSDSKRDSVAASRHSIGEGYNPNLKNSPMIQAAEREYRKAGGPKQTGHVPEAAQIVKKLPFNVAPGESISKEAVAAIKTLWADCGIQYCFTRANEFQLMDCCKYFLDSIDRISANDFVPSEQDILNCRVMTTSIVETKIVIKDVTVKIFDVGGQRSERKKWAPYFDDVSAIIYLTAISSYDQVCYEDNSTNRILESLNLFSSICNHPMFKKTSMILFMNKIDLFKIKLEASPVINYFPTYEGPNDYDNASEYFASRFLALNKYPERKVYVHFTWATDTKQTKKVLDTVNKIILNSNLEHANI